jgi:hypothetical protein
VVVLQSRKPVNARSRRFRWRNPSLRHFSFPRSAWERRLGRSASRRLPAWGHDAERRLPCVPTLRVGTQVGTLCVPSPASVGPRRGASPPVRSHAERGNEKRREIAPLHVAQPLPSFRLETYYRSPPPRKFGEPAASLLHFGARLAKLEEIGCGFSDVRSSFFVRIAHPAEKFVAHKPSAAMGLFRSSLLLLV